MTNVNNDPATTMTEEPMLREEACKFLKANLRTLDYLVRTDQIPYSRFGKRGVRFLKSRLVQWLHEREGVEYKRVKK